MIKLYANGWSLRLTRRITISCFVWRDRMTWRSVKWAWRLQDIQRGISIPVLGTRRTLSISKRSN